MPRSVITPDDLISFLSARSSSAAVRHATRTIRHQSNPAALVTHSAIEANAALNIRVTSPRIDQRNAPTYGRILDTDPTSPTYRQTSEGRRPRSTRNRPDTRTVRTTRQTSAYAPTSTIPDIGTHVTYRTSSGQLNNGHVVSTQARSITVKPANFDTTGDYDIIGAHQITATR